VSGHLFIRVSESAQSGVEGVVTDRAVTTQQRRKNVTTVTGKKLRATQDVAGLCRERNDMKLALLHTLAGYAPLGFVEIKLCVFHFA
jgi:hypothetical protein